MTSGGITPECEERFKTIFREQSEHEMQLAKFSDMFRLHMEEAIPYRQNVKSNAEAIRVIRTWVLANIIVVLISLLGFAVSWGETKEKVRRIEFNMDCGLTKVLPSLKISQDGK